MGSNPASPTLSLDSGLRITDGGSRLTFMSRSTRASMTRGRVSSRVWKSPSMMLGLPAKRALGLLWPEMGSRRARRPPRDDGWRRDACQPVKAAMARRSPKRLAGRQALDCGESASASPLWEHARNPATKAAPIPPTVRQRSGRDVQYCQFENFEPQMNADTRR